jgi:hypothetical protein
MNSNFCTEIQHSFDKNSVGKYNPPHYRNENNWEDCLPEEIERLQLRLHYHLKKMGITKNKNERIQIVNKLLRKQNNTCAFGKYVKGKYCWNESKENFTKTNTKNKKDGKYVELPSLKLQWGHIKPRCRKESQNINDLYLLCARCNNQIQTSRHLTQVLEELESKILHIDQFIQEHAGTFKSTEEEETVAKILLTLKKDESTQVIKQTKVKGCRVMSVCFKPGQRIRHTIGINKTWEGIYEEGKGIVHNGITYNSISKFASMHYSIVNISDNKKSANGWLVCECEVDGKWISTHNL